MPQSQREFLEQNAAFRGAETAIRSVNTGETWTYAKFDAKVNEVANALHQRGLRTGDRVALVLRNTVEFPVSMYACHKVGLVAIPINYRLSDDEMRTIFDDANVSVAIYDETFADDVESAASETLRPTDLVCVGDSADGTETFDELVRAGSAETPPPVDRSADDLAYIIYTSGTTGRPKGVVHTVSSARERTLATIVSFDVTPDSVFLSQLPYFHGGGLDAAIRSAVTAGGELVVSAEYADPAVSLDAIERHDVTHVIGVPTVSKRVIDYEGLEEYDLSTIECWYHTGEVMLEDRARQFREELTPNVINSYGSSEGGFITVLRSDALTEQAGTVGRPTLGTQIRIVELDATSRVDPSQTVPRGAEGEVIIRSDQLFYEYFQNAEATHEAFHEGWYYTNDVGIVNEDGYLKITGRVDDVIISGGELIAPAAVEEALESHDGVREAVVVGEPDEQWGERVVAHVDCEAEVTADELDAFCRDESGLAEYKRPRRYEFVSEIVHTESGKKARSRYRSQ